MAFCLFIHEKVVHKLKKKWGVSRILTSSAASHVFHLFLVGKFVLKNSRVIKNQCLMKGSSSSRFELTQTFQMKHSC